MIPKQAAASVEARNPTESRVEVSKQLASRPEARETSSCAASQAIPPRFQEGSQPSLAEVLERREARVLQVQDLLQRHATVVCFKLNIPGPVKNNASIQALFVQGLRALRASWPHKDRKTSPAAPPPLSTALETGTDPGLLAWDWEQALPNLPTGPEYFLASSLPADLVKHLMVNLEETPLGRLYDIDVFGPQGQISRTDLGLPLRSCFLCERPAPACARSRRHSLGELLGWVDQQLDASLSGKLKF